MTGLGLDPAHAVPLLAPVLGHRSARRLRRRPRPRAASSRSRSTRRVLDYIVACTRRQPALVVAENLHWFDDATRALLASSRGADRQPARRRHLAPPRARALGDDRAAPADARRPPRADRRARARPDRAGPARARRPQRRHPALRRGARARGRGPPPRRTPPLPCPGRCPRRSTSRSWRGSTRRRRAAGGRDRRRRRATGRPLAARGDDGDRRTRSSTRPSGRSSTRAVLEPVDGRSRPLPVPPRAPARGRLRAAAALVAPQGPRPALRPPRRDEPGDWHVLASHFERAERYHEAAEAYQNTAEWARRRGALDEARAHLTRAIELVEPLTTTRRATISRSSCACAAGSSRCRPRARPARTRPPTSTAASSWPRRTRGRRHVQHADRAVGVLPVARRARPRPRDLGDALRDALDGERDVFRAAEPAPASGCSTGSAAASTARSTS